ncbi:MAG: hypothetical protein FJ290_30105, partial [Planctomycetes bacterium]|nr:hypothetical protein [Planctomycetota bacterium]
TEKGWRRVQTLRDRVIGPLKIAPSLLRKGVNVLAIEVRTSHYHPFILPTGGVRRWGAHGGYENYTWDHCRLLRLELRDAAGKLPSMLARPAGVQAWAADMHTRVYTPDYNPAGLPSGVVRLVGARNGTYSGQVVVGTDRELTGLEAVCGGLAGDSIAMIPASAVQVLPMKGQPIWTLEFLGHDRSLDLRFDPKYPRLTATGEVAAVRYGIYEGLPAKPRHEIPAKVMEVYDRFRFFDHISAAWPEKVPADTCQALWVYLRVPSEAAPGLYRGTITVSADDVNPMTVPLEVEVAHWRVPDPLAFQTLVESEQSPYAIAKHYGAPLWSDEHFKLMEASFRQLARLGADWLFVPVLLNSELGNREDSPIKWIRDKRGELRFGFATMDRYLDLAVKHWGVPRVICFLVMHGVSAPSSHVKLLDEAAGKEELVDVGPGQDAAVRRPLWQAFATALLEHVKARGMERSVYWGHVFDNIADPELITILREFAPHVHWAAGAHARQPDATFRATARAYGSDILDRSSCGWKNPFIHLLMPRAYGSVICVEGTSTPFTHRVMCDRAIYAGFNGIGRMGADYFDNAWFDGFRGREWYLVGRSCVQTLWPGEDGAEASARHETMLEGIQEAEARIFLEQCLERGVLKGGLGEQVRAVLDRHVRETLYIPGGACGIDLMDYTGDWRARSRRLYDAAAKAAEQVGLDVNVMALGAVEIKNFFQGKEQTVFTGDGILVPALGKATATVMLRNWTNRPRAWRAAGSEPWLKPQKPEGQAPPGQHELAITLDGSGLKAGEAVVGTLTITDVAGGTEYPVKITAKVGEPVELLVERPVLNIVAGQPDSLTFKLANNTDGEQRFQFASAERWLKVAPASGKLGAGKAAFVKFTASPAKLPPGSVEVEVTLTAAGGAVAEKLAFTVYSVAEYQPPKATPAGEAVLLDRLPWDKHGKAHESGSKKGEAPRMGARDGGKRKLAIGEKTYEHGLWVNPAHRTAYNIEGAGFETFAAEVGVATEVAKNIERYGAARGQQVCFEVYVDGACRAQSGFMKATDGPRTLVVDGLRSVKELVLVTRTRGGADAAILCHWAEARLYRPR